MRVLFKPKYLLILICLFFLLTRFYKIAEIPLSVYWDEASIGYNAYSVLKTAKDEWGDFLPIHLRAFGEFKLPVYIYATVLTVKLFGLNEFSVRVPSVLFSLGVVILTFLVGRKLTDSSYIGLWSSFLVTISPWFFIFSRTGYEATAGLMFYLLGIYLFLRLRENRWSIPVSILSFILSVYSYNSFRIISPLTILLLCSMNTEILIKQKVSILVSIILIILAVIPIYRLFVYDTGIARYQTVGSLPQLIISNYLSHFNPTFLFISGDKNLRSQQEGFGQLYFPEIIFITLGLIYIMSGKLKYKWLPIVLMLLGPIPAAITKESPHALRSLSSVPFIHIISAIGVIYLEQILRKKYLVNLATIAILLFLFINYFINFLTIYPAHSSKDWQYGYKEIFTESNIELEKKDKVLVSERDGQPYIFALFYLKYDPEKFRQEVVRNSVDRWGFSTVKKFGKFEFGGWNPIESVASKGVLYVLTPSEYDGLLGRSNFDIKKIIYYPNGTTAFYLVSLR